MEVVEAVLGPKKSNISKCFVSVRGWPGNIFEVFWWSFGMICIVLMLFSMHFSVNFLKKLPYGVTWRRRFGGRRGGSGTEKIIFLKVFVSVRGWPGNIFEVFWLSFEMICIVFILFSMYRKFGF